MKQHHPSESNARRPRRRLAYGLAFFVLGYLAAQWPPFAVPSVDASQQTPWNPFAGLEWESDGETLKLTAAPGQPHLILGHAEGPRGFVELQAAWIDPELGVAAVDLGQVERLTLVGPSGSARLDDLKQNFLPCTPPINCPFPPDPDDPDGPFPSPGWFQQEGF